MNNKPDVSQIYQDFRDPLKAFIGRRISDPDSTEDLLHDVFIKIHNQIGSLKDREKLAPWIYQIARNALIDHYRRKTEFISASEQDVPADPLEISDIPDKLAPVLHAMIRNLPEKYREAILLVDFEGARQTELAKKLGITVSAAKSRVQRGRQMLKELLLECCHFEFDRYGTVFDYRPKNCGHCCEENGKCGS